MLSVSCITFFHTCSRLVMISFVILFLQFLSIFYSPDSESTCFTIFFHSFLFISCSNFHISSSGFVISLSMTLQLLSALHMFPLVMRACSSLPLIFRPLCSLHRLLPREIFVSDLNLQAPFNFFLLPLLYEGVLTSFSIHSPLCPLHQFLPQEWLRFRGDF